jgi:hypothetical protein
MGAGFSPLVPAEIETDWPRTMMLPVAIVGQVPITAGIVGSPEPTAVVPLLLPLLPPAPLSFLVVDPELDPELELELEPPLELEVAPPPLELDPVLDPWDPLELPVPLELPLWIADPSGVSPSVMLGAGGAVPLAQLAAAAAAADAVTSAKAEADQRAIPIVLTL